MTIIDRLNHLAAAWSVASGRPVTTLSSRVANDGKFFDRLRDGRSCTVATAERCFAFFRDPASWPGAIPDEAAALLNGVDLGASREQAA